MRTLRTGLLFLLAAAWAPANEDLVKPDRVPISTWVREDLFAGWIMNDAATFERGVQKLDRHLQDHPADTTAQAWKYFAVSYRIRTAREKGDGAAATKLAAEAAALREKVFAGAPKDPGPYIIVGSSLIMLADYAAEENRPAMYREGRELLRKVPVLQEQYFEKLPPHFRGELWGEIAFASDRLGEGSERDRVLNEMTDKLAGSPYAARAKGWMKGSSLAGEKQYTCISCHEPGRLAPTLSRLNQPKP